MPLEEALVRLHAAFQMQLWSPMSAKGSEKDKTQLFYMMCTEAGTGAEGE